jgi:hypothetical protein
LPIVVALLSGPPTKPGDFTYDDWWRHLTRIRVTIARDTTYATDPLKPDGTVDYLNAINALFAEVKPEDNAAVLLAQALGPGVAPPENAAEYFRLLQCPQLPEKGAYLVNYFKEWRDEETRNLLAKCMVAPWSPQQHPRFVELLKRCESGLKLVSQASKRKRFYEPWVASTPGGDRPFNEQHLSQELRLVARLMMLRAMLRLHEGRLDEAIEDCECCHRLTHVIQVGPKTLREGLVASFTSTFVMTAETAIPRAGLGSSALYRTRAKRFLDMSKLPMNNDNVVALERLENLHETVRALRLGFERGLQGEGEEAGLWQKLAAAWLIDADVVLRTVNQAYDELETLEKIADSVEQIRRTVEVENQFQQRYWMFRRNPVRIWWDDIRELGVRRGSGRWFGRLILTFTMPAKFMALAGSPRVALNRQRQTALVYLFAAYKKDHGQYPASLDAATLGAPPEAVVDPFTEKPFVYRVVAGKRQIVSAGYDRRIETHVRADDTDSSRGDDIIAELPE